MPSPLLKYTLRLIVEERRAREESRRRRVVRENGQKRCEEVREVRET